MVSGRIRWLNCVIKKIHSVLHFTREILAAKIRTVYPTLKKELKIGLRLCFDGNHYFKTKDNLYVSTDKNYENVYYYEVYVPWRQASLSMRA